MKHQAFVLFAIAIIYTTSIFASKEGFVEIPPKYYTDREAEMYYEFLENVTRMPDHMKTEKIKNPLNIATAMKWHIDKLSDKQPDKRIDAMFDPYIRSLTGQHWFYVNQNHLSHDEYIAYFYAFIDGIYTSENLVVIEQQKMQEEQLKYKQSHDAETRCTCIIN